MRREPETPRSTHSTSCSFRDGGFPEGSTATARQDSRRYESSFSVSASSACRRKLRRDSSPTGEPSFQSNARNPPALPLAALATPARSIWTVARTCSESNRADLCRLRHVPAPKGNTGWVSPLSQRRSAVRDGMQQRRQ
jgi:hypothetical protein